LVLFFKKELLASGLPFSLLADRSSLFERLMIEILAALLA